MSPNSPCRSTCLNLSDRWDTYEVFRPMDNKWYVTRHEELNLGVDEPINAHQLSQQSRIVSGVHLRHAVNCSNSEFCNSLMGIRFSGISTGVS